MSDFRWAAITAAGLSVFAAAEAFVVDVHDWVPRCKFPSELCEPSSKPWIDGGRGTLVNTIGIGASPNVAIAIADTASTGSRVVKVSLDGSISFS